MSVRILNPVISELCKIPSAPSMVSRNLSCGQQIKRIKRDLFGTSNPVETNRLFSEELERNQQLAKAKWGFDFRKGMPLNTNSQFVWERVSCQEFSYAPQQYTLTRAAHVRPNIKTHAQPTAMNLLLDERADHENFVSNYSSADTDSCDDSQDESTSPVAFKVPLPVITSHCTAGSRCQAEKKNVSKAQLALRKRQPKITEFMKERKRLAQTPKKLSPTKRSRLSFGSTISSSDSHHRTYFDL